MPEQVEVIDYAVELKDLLERPLTPRTIGDYAEGALSDVSDWLGRVTTAYLTETQDRTLDDEDDAERTSLVGQGDVEDVALLHFGLDPVDELLDHIGKVADQISGLDAVIEQAGAPAKVITPSGRGRGREQDADIISPDRERSTEVLPRLKTVLFVLQSEFHIDIHTAGEIILDPGVVGPNSSRKEGYYFLRIPSLGRTLLVCDEMGNATYVFDDAKREEISLDDELLKNLSRPEIEERLKDNRGLGVRLKYSDNYAASVTSALQDVGAYSDSRRRRAISYIVPPAPDGHMSVVGVARHLAVSYENADAIIQSIRPTLGAIALHRFGSRTSDSFAPGQVELLEQEAIRLGYAYNRRSESYPEIARRKMKRLFGVGDKDLDEAIDVLHEARLSRADVMNIFHVNEDKVDETLEMVRDVFGEIKTYLFGSQRRPGYDPWQQNMVFDYLNAKGLIAPEAPEDVWSMKRMYQEWHVSQGTIRRAVGRIGESIGTIDHWKFYGNISDGFTSQQRALILGQLREDGVEVREAA